VRKLEQLGAQAMLPPMQEWLSYIASERRDLHLEHGRYVPLLKEWAIELTARWREGRIARVFDGSVRHMAREERTGRVLEMGADYLHPTVKGEAVLSMGRAVEYAHAGFDGVVNVAPFGCMPGTIVDSLLEKFRRDHQGIPVLKLAFDGVEAAADETVLGAFVHQAQQFMESKKP